MIATRRAAVSLDGTWEFVPDPERRHGADRLPHGSPITVPGAWEAQLQAPYEIVNAWYRRRFTVPDDWRGGTLLLRFGAAMTGASVWLDGRLLGAHADGHLPFEAEAGAPRPGTEHELVVAVENPLNIITEYPLFGDDAIQIAREHLDGRSFESVAHGKQTWYTSTSGLLGPVVAEWAPNARFAALVVLPDLEGKRALVRWRLAGSAADHAANVLLRLTSPGGEVVAAMTADAHDGTATIAVPQPDAWDLRRPKLYRLDAQLQSRGGDADGPLGNAPADEASVRFGMRSIAVREGSILLNGRPIFLRGVLDQDFWPVGRSNPPSREALEAQAAMAGEMGFNLLRCHIKIPDPAYLDVADEAGLLVWCELPSWSRFDVETGRSGRRLLARMVEEMGSHPSIVAWTVINESWGMDLRNEARDRRWLRSTVEELKSIDPTRLVVDNSACDTPFGPNFHVRTDLADFHAYRSMPGGLAWWQGFISDFARHPPWLWSPHGDAAPSGDEALVLSEFGGWGLPLPSAVRTDDDREPWWWETGRTITRPAGLHRRFREQGLDRIWAGMDDLAADTQWRQFDALAAQARAIRRHPSIKGYVVTELADAYWEANGMLDVGRGPKAFHERIGELNAPDVLIVGILTADLWGDDQLRCDVVLASYPDAPGAAVTGEGTVEWKLDLEGGGSTRGSLSFEDWPESSARTIAELELAIPGVDDVTRAELRLSAGINGERPRAQYSQSIMIVPSTGKRTNSPRAIHVVDPLDLWSVAPRLRALGHEIVPLHEADLIVASVLDRTILAEVDRGKGLVLLARSPDAIPAGLGLARPLEVRRRRGLDGQPLHERPWDGDWIGVYAWALPGRIPGLPDGGLLGDAHGEVFPDHVLTGLDVASTADGVQSGLFAGWVHSPAALLATFEQGAGRIVVTTFHVAPEPGPAATALLEALVQQADTGRRLFQRGAAG